MPRTLLAALLATTTLVAGAAQAQTGRAPTYDDGQPPPGLGGYYDSYASSDAREADAPSSRWVTPRPYAREDQVDEGTPNDAAHRADRAYTAELNRRASGRNSTPYPSYSSSSGGGYAQAQGQYRAELAAHDQQMAAYRAAQRRYAERIAQWRARANACEAGDIYACEGPE